MTQAWDDGRPDHPSGVRAGRQGPLSRIAERGETAFLFGDVSKNQGFQRSVNPTIAGGLAEARLRHLRCRTSERLAPHWRRRHAAAAPALMRAGTWSIVVHGVRAASPRGDRRSRKMRMSGGGGSLEAEC